MHINPNTASQNFTFCSKRYCFSLLSEGHRDFYYSLYTDKIVMEKIATPLGLESLSTLFQHVIKHNEMGIINQSKSLSWAIVDISTNLLVGIQGFIQNKSNKLEAEFGIMILPGNHLKGIASESICALIKYGFTHLEFSKVYANYTLQNRAIQRIAENLDFNICDAHQQPSSKLCWLTKQDFDTRQHLFKGQ